MSYDTHDTGAAAVVDWQESADEAQMAANARLIAEAGTVAHETGLTPRQLASLNAELVEAIGQYMSAFGQALEAHGIKMHEQQADADCAIRAVLAKFQPKPEVT